MTLSLRLRPSTFAAALIVLWAVAATTTQAAPEAELLERWTRHDAASNRVLNHGLWRDFLQRYVVAGDDGIHRVDYAAVSSDDGGLLRVYIDDLQRTPVSQLRRAEQFAYWINLYNAVTVKLVLERYPVQSIRDISISPGLFSKGPWGARLIKVEGENLSLDDIEHRILRPIWRDARIHYAVNCAALGCPNLPREPFTAANTEALLDAGARAYVNHPRGVRIDEQGQLIVSSIYHWYADDFGADAAGLIDHLRRHAGAALAAELQGVSNVHDHAYDWSLNDLR